MEASKSASFFLLCFFLLFFSASACDRCVRHSKAAHFSYSASPSVGTCGYGSMALEFTGGHVAAGSPAIYRDGLGCGACFQVRCKNTRVCRSAGVKVTLTDLNKGNSTGLVLNKGAFVSMAKNGKAQELMRRGIVDVEYKRIPCEYSRHNLSIRVEETKKGSNHLAIKLLYQGGQTDILGVDVAQVDSPIWHAMDRDYGPVWSTIGRVPARSLYFRMVITGGYDGKWLWTPKAVLPADWTIGSVYDMGIQIADTAQEDCYPCDSGEWK
ncbi:expansin-like A2 isoform X1 [Zingiber officinale]|uniref:Expansin-like A2 n=1 Tax=Zingiber officinale TaxID=94328 RepID=A0A8J5LBP6_ZINOF|nr:expansin-like A2 isoform X1 [Zingiber officinale]KAG6507246.1 hypothetical protein ZIOFF_032588 [Zingiber officinale]